MCVSETKQIERQVWFAMAPTFLMSQQLKYAGLEVDNVNIFGIFTLTEHKFC